MSWSKVFSGQVRDPVTDLIVTQRDEASPISVEGTANIEGGVVAVAEFRKVWEI